MAKVSKEFESFFNWSKQYLKENGISLVIVDKKILKIDGNKWAGAYYNKKLKIAGKNKFFEQIYVHEFCHAMQEVEQAEVYMKADGKWWTDLEIEEVSIDSWDSLFKIIAFERDCEKRAIALGKKWKLFDVEEYAQRANAYLNFYLFSFIERSCSFKSDDIFHEKIIDAMPKKLLPLSYFSSINMQTMKLFGEILNKK